MPNHTIFNERPESQDRALKVIERLGYTIIPRSEAEQKRGSRKAVLFTGELQAFLSKQTYQFGSERRFFSGGSIAKAMQAVDQYSAAGLYASNKEIYELLCSGKSMEEDLPDGTSAILTSITRKTTLSRLPMSSKWKDRTANLLVRILLCWSMVFPLL